MLKIREEDKEILRKTLGNGFKLVVDDSHRALGVIELSIGKVLLNFELLSSNCMKLCGAVSRKDLTQAVHLEEYNHKYYFYFYDFTSEENVSEELKTSFLTVEDKPFEGYKGKSFFIRSYDVMNVERENFEPDLVYYDIPAFVQKVGCIEILKNGILPQESFKKYQITAQEFEKVMKLLKFVKTVEDAWYVFESSEKEVTENQKLWTRWKIGDIVFTSMDKFIEVKSGQNIFYVMKPNDLYREVIKKTVSNDVDKTYYAFRLFRSPGIEKI